MKNSIQHYNLFIGILLCVVFTIELQAQNQEKDVLFLKNGSVIKGKILEMVFGGNVKIETADGSIFIYKTEDVLKMEKQQIKYENQPPTQQPSTNSEQNESVQTYTPEYSQSYDAENDKVVMYISGGLLVGQTSGIPNSLLGDIDNIALGHTITIAYRPKPAYSVGLGAAIQTYEWPMAGLFIDTKFFVGKKRIKPFVYSQIGYSALIFGGDIFDFNSSWMDSKGGLLLEGGAGLALQLGRSFHFNISVGALHQRHNYTLKDSSWDNRTGQQVESNTEVKDIFNRIPLRITFMF